MNYLYESNYQFWHIFYFLSGFITICIGCFAVVNDLYRNGVAVEFFKPQWISIPLMLLAALGGLLSFTSYGLMTIYLVYVLLLSHAPFGAFAIMISLFIIVYYSMIKTMFNIRSLKI